MVKVKSPFASLDATGKLADVLGFARSKRGTVAGVKRNPKQPRTLEQRATRIWMSWLAKQWSVMNIAEKTTFFPPGLEWNLPPYNAYLRYNLKRLQGLPDRYTALQGYDFFPTRYYETTPTGSPDSITSVSTTGLVNSFIHRVNVSAIYLGWFFSWHILDGGRAGVTYSGTIRIQDPLPIGIHDILIENITPGFHEFVFGPVNKWGIPRVNYFKRNVTVLPP